MLRTVNKNGYGFTLIELLVIIAIIGLISAVITVRMAETRNKAKNARAESDMVAIRNAIALLSTDTGKWPNGCPINKIYPVSGAGTSNEVPLYDQDAGLLQRPSAGVNDAGGNCEWTVKEVNDWKGPYIADSANLLDPWGNPYWFDNDYVARRDCAGLNYTVKHSVISSAGENGLGGASNDIYDCDDVYVNLNN